MIVFAGIADSKVLIELSSPGETVNMVLQVLRKGVPIMESAMTLETMRGGFPMREFIIPENIIQFFVKFLGLEAVTEADREDQLLESGGQAKFVKYIGTLHGNIHNDQVCHLHLLADAVADDVIGYRVGICTMHMNMGDRLPLIINLFLGQTVIVYVFQISG